MLLPYTVKQFNNTPTQTDKSSTRSPAEQRCICLPWYRWDYPSRSCSRRPVQAAEMPQIHLQGLCKRTTTSPLHRTAANTSQDVRHSTSHQDVIITSYCTLCRSPESKQMGVLKQVISSQVYCFNSRIQKTKLHNTKLYNKIHIYSQEDLLPSNQHHHQDKTC